MPAEPWPMWTLYGHPCDHPDKIVVRRWDIVEGAATPTDDMSLHDTVKQARDHVKKQGGQLWMDRQPNDDPVILETWM